MDTREDTSVYTRNGYKDREDYLKNLADDWGLELFAVNMVADLLGPSEDFDGLVSELEDMDCIGALDAFRV
ncbi:hypothetical protein AGMMS49546_39080 [Spirochaetia bacterium]|nr:hypothetical protein FACS189483_05190 [Spirochaetia bacterium]GHV48482.1 hypothetical protein AGMMS49546_39080 [Spirochaetia bacterium]